MNRFDPVSVKARLDKIYIATSIFQHRLFKLRHEMMVDDTFQFERFESEIFEVSSFFSNVLLEIYATSWFDDVGRIVNFANFIKSVFHKVKK